MRIFTLLLVGMIACAAQADNEILLDVGKSWYRFATTEDEPNPRLSNIETSIDPPNLSISATTSDHGYFNGENTEAWKVEVGYLWDIGKEGGFRSGLTGAYVKVDSIMRRTVLGPMAPRGNVIIVEIESEDLDYFTIRWVGDQTLGADWARFYFKIGPAGMLDSGGLSSEIGFAFRLVRPLWLTLSYEDVVVFDIDSSDSDDLVGLGGGTLALQFRF